MLLLTQIPGNGDRIVRFSGDCLKLTFRLNENIPGEAFVRTNLCRGSIRRREVIAQVEHKKARMGRDWHDIKMPMTAPGVYSITLPLNEIGLFEFKCFFLPEGGGVPQWPRGENSRVKVEPSNTSSNNTIYNAFVRQFGKNRSGGAWQEEHRSAEKFLDASDYTVVPPSGTFRDLKTELAFIMDELGFRIIQLLPIHPTPVSFARMGRFGSPFAPTDFYSVDTSMATFDRRTTPLEQFCELVDAIHARGGLVLIDLPANHTGWASTLQVHHPEWFSRNPDGSFESPGAWGVVWEDLCKLNFEDQKLWIQMADIFLHWTRLGVDGFRCDAGYMVPMRVWEYIAAKVREEYPETIFFLEGLGGPPYATEELLQEGRLNWAYSELFQCYEPQQVRDYLAYSYGFSKRNGCLVNFAETHDNDRLAARSPRWAAMRTGLAALTSVNGAFGIANGVEWLATEKINVHGSASLNWGATPNLVAHLKRLNQILGCHPAFRSDVDVRLPSSGSGDAVGILRICRNRHDSVLVVFNVNERTHAWFEWESFELDLGDEAYDLLSGQRVDAIRTEGRLHLDLLPGQIKCLARKPLSENDLDPVHANEWQTLRYYVLKSIVHYYDYLDVTGVDIDELAKILRDDPKKFMGRLFDAKTLFPHGECEDPMGQEYLPFMEWDVETDSRKALLVPPNHLILVTHTSRFRASLMSKGKCLSRQSSFKASNGLYYTLFMPAPFGRITWKLELHVEAFDGETARRVVGKLLQLPIPKGRPVRLRQPVAKLDDTALGLCSNATGGYVQARALWGNLLSKYDAFLAACPAQDYPDDRIVLLSRFRVWLNYRDHNVELDSNCQVAFTNTLENELQWDFAVHSGMGQNVYLRIEYRMDPGPGNRCQMRISRLISPESDPNGLPPETPVTLTVRPEIDFRVNHENTKAYNGPETQFPKALEASDNGFTFTPSGPWGLRVAANAPFTKNPKWQYGVQMPEDAARGLDAANDQFSPGAFNLDLKGGDEFRLEATGEILERKVQPLKIAPWIALDAPTQLPFDQALLKAMKRYIADREGNKTIIAGFPWFLDWGRDTLICLKGLIAAKLFDESRDIIRQFASFEHNGTIPNMIRGKDSGNRSTSDAPLWLFAAVSDFVQQAPKSYDLLNMDCDGRPLAEILVSIADNYYKGTDNGIKVDQESCLVFSPSHFTWMDTNHPAGTPRQGYPIEIQALWIHVLEFIVNANIAEEPYATWANTARNSVKALYTRGEGLSLSDCLLADPGTSAMQAVQDDAIRPNQLLMLTLTDVFHKTPTATAILEDCSRLLVPGGIRSLAPTPVNVPIRIEHRGQLLNDPWHPYWGRYEGDEDTRRKPAYHNGTAWGWQMPLYCEALVKNCGQQARIAATALLCSAIDILEQGSIGHLPEIVDGDWPHTERGCLSQAWSVCEAYRVATLLLEQKPSQDGEKPGLTDDEECIN